MKFSESESNSLGGKLILKCAQNQEESFDLDIVTRNIFQQSFDYVNFQHKCWTDRGLAEQSSEWQSFCPLQLFACSKNALTFFDIQKFMSIPKNSDEDFNSASDKFESCKIVVKTGEVVSYTWNNFAYELSYETTKKNTASDSSYLDLPPVITEAGEKVIADLFIYSTNKEDTYFTLPITSGSFLRKDYINFKTKKWVTASEAESQKDDCPLQVFMITSLTIVFNDVRVLKEKENTASFKEAGDVLSKAKVEVKKDEKVPLLDPNNPKQPVIVEWNDGRYVITYSDHAPVRY